MLDLSLVGFFLGSNPHPRSKAPDFGPRKLFVHQTSNHSSPNLVPFVERSRHRPLPFALGFISTTFWVPFSWPSNPAHCFVAPNRVLYWPTKKLSSSFNLFFHGSLSSLGPSEKIMGSDQSLVAAGEGIPLPAPPQFSNCLHFE